MNTTKPTNKPHEFVSVGDDYCIEAAFGEKHCGQPRSASVHQPVADTCTAESCPFNLPRPHLIKDHPQLVHQPAQQPVVLGCAAHGFRFNEGCDACSAVWTAAPELQGEGMRITAEMLLEQIRLSMPDLILSPKHESGLRVLFTTALVNARATPPPSQREGELVDVMRSLQRHDGFGIRPKGTGSQVPRECPCCEKTENSEGVISHYLSCHFEQARKVLAEFEIARATPPAPEGSDWAMTAAETWFRDAQKVAKEHPTETAPQVLARIFRAAAAAAPDAEERAREIVQEWVDSDLDTSWSIDFDALTIFIGRPREIDATPLINRIAAVLTTHSEAHEKPNWLWCERCQAWIETQHECGAQYIDRGTHLELARREGK